MKKKVTNCYPDRKPDMETESFRMWKSDKNSKEDIKKIADDFKDQPVINYKGHDLVIGGFNVVYDRPNTEKDKKVIFAYKFKHDKKDILFYLGDNPDEKVLLALAVLKAMAITIGYVITDMRDNLDSVAVEMDIIKHKEKNEKTKNN